LKLKPSVYKELHFCANTSYRTKITRDVVVGFFRFLDEHTLVILNNVELT